MEALQEQVRKIKHELRQRLRTLGRATITDLDRERWSTSIVEQLRRHPLWLSAQHIGLYVALPDEPNLRPLLEESTTEKSLYLPRVLGAEAMEFFPFISWELLKQTGSFGLYEPQGTEPISPQVLDLIVVPALAYDHEGYRLGRGKGYYDRYLARTKAKRIGVSFGLQRDITLPHASWDIPMDAVLYP